MTFENEVIIFFAKAATNSLDPVVSNSDNARRHSKIYHLRPKKLF